MDNDPVIVCAGQIDQGDRGLGVAWNTVRLAVRRDGPPARARWLQASDWSGLDGRFLIEVGALTRSEPDQPAPEPLGDDQSQRERDRRVGGDAHRRDHQHDE